MTYANVEDARAQSRRWQKQHRAKVNAIKEASPCADCGVSYPARVMDFDHVRGQKAGIIGRMVSDHVAWATIEAEIAKCDLVCSNCHRLRHHG